MDEEPEVPEWVLKFAEEMRKRGGVVYRDDPLIETIYFEDGDAT